MNVTNLTHNFLIAMPQLDDPNFFHSATYLCDHSADGAMGFIFNHPLELDLASALQQMDITTELATLSEQPVYYGGPVEEDRGFVLHRPVSLWESTLVVSDELAITTSQDILNSIAEEKGPEQYMVVLGYAGWGSGQLEQELAENVWLSGPANLDIIFDTPAEQRWEKSALNIGVDINLLSGDSGHA